MPGYVPEQHDDVLRALVAEGLAESKMPDRLRAIGVVISWRKLKEHLVRLGLAQPTKPRRPATGPPVQTPVQRVDTGAVSSVDTGAVQPLDTGAVQRLDRLEGEVQGLTQVVRSLVDRLNSTPVQTPVQITTLPPYPKGKAVRWNLWIVDAIQDELKIMAAERDVSPSQLVQELLWAALRERRQEGTP
jgi:hypothetical protein